MKGDGLQIFQHCIVGMVFSPIGCHEWHWKRNYERCVFLGWMTSIVIIVFQWTSSQIQNLPNYNKRSFRDRFSGKPCHEHDNKLCIFLRTRFRFFFSWNRIRRWVSVLCTHSIVFEFHHECMVWVAYLVDSLSWRNCQDHFSITFGGKS